MLSSALSARLPTARAPCPGTARRERDVGGPEHSTEELPHASRDANPHPGTGGGLQGPTRGPSRLSSESFQQTHINTYD